MEVAGARDLADEGPSASSPTLALRPPRSIPLRRIGAWSLATVLVLLAVFWLVEDPMAHAWYQAHQGALARDFQIPRLTARPGQAVATIQVPAIRLNLIVGQGDSAAQLRSGPGHKPGTPFPGAKGNSVIFGHRHGWGAPFAGLSRLRPGDALIAEDRNRDILLYTVTTVRRVGARDAGPLASSEDYRITLLTGTGGRLDTSRLVVTAVSGQTGKQRAPARSLSASVPSSSVIANRGFVVFLLRLGVAVAAFGVLRRRFGRTVKTVVLTPLLAAVGLALMLDLDFLLSPLG